jgi:hypothetical protein
MVLGGVIAWSITDPWYVLGILLVGPLIAWRRRTTR